MHISISFDLPLPGLRSGGVLEIYRLATLLPTFWLAIVQCRMCGGHAFHFGVAVATMVVAVATMTANITLGPATRTGPLALEIAGAAVFSVLWFVVGLTHTTRLFASIYVGLYGLVLGYVARGLLRRGESPWGRRVHALGERRIALEKDHDATQAGTESEQINGGAE